MWKRLLAKLEAGSQGALFFLPTQARAAVSPQKRKADGKTHRGCSSSCPRPQPSILGKSPERDKGYVRSVAPVRMVGVWGFGQPEPGWR